MVRRGRYDPFATEHASRARRLRVVSQFGEVVATRTVPAGADLRAEFAAELARWTAHRRRLAHGRLEALAAEIACRVWLHDPVLGSRRVGIQDALAHVIGRLRHLP
jgi:hypothetical protein